MNVRMIASIFLFVGLMISGMAAGQEEPMAAILPFVDIPSIIIVVGVVISGTMWSFPIEKTEKAFWDACSIGQVDEERAKQGYLIFQSMAGYSIGGGILGTIIGLVKMLKDMSDPTAIGPSMSIALITTLYGSMIANCYAIPMAKKLEARSREEVAEKQLIARGILSILARDSVQIIMNKLNARLAPTSRVNKEGG